MSTRSTETSSLPPPYSANWEQSNDIRSDLATGWGQQQQQEAENNGMRSRGGSNNRLRNRITADGDSMDDGNDDDNQQWGWRLQFNAVRPVPQFYPLDPRSVRRINLSMDNDSILMDGGDDGMMDDADTAASATIEEISNRISTACQCLSIHGVWDNLCPSTTLSSMEQVEMEINLYLSEGDGAGECG